MKSFSKVFLAHNLVVKTWVNDNNSTDVEVTFLNEHGVPVISASGHTKLNPTDIYEPEVGKQIAFGRALERFGRKYTAYAESLSETPSQRKGRLRVARRIYEQGILFENLVIMDKIDQAREKRTQNRPEQPKTALEAVPITEVAPANR